MKLIIERDSLIPAFIVVGVVCLIFLGGAVGLAYIGGVFTGKDAVKANDERITKEALSTSHPAPETPEP